MHVNIACYDVIYYAQTYFSISDLNGTGIWIDESLQLIGMSVPLLTNQYIVFKISSFYITLYSVICNLVSEKILASNWKSRWFNITPGNPFAYPVINVTHPFCYLSGNVHFDWFNQYLCTGEHFQSDLDIFQFDFVFLNHTMCLRCFALTCKLKWDFA